MGYVLPFGQMSFWGATVITNLLSPFPSLIEWVCGGHYIYNPSLKRFFLFHFQFPFLLCGFIILHIFYVHFHSSNNPLRINVNNKRGCERSSHINCPFLNFLSFLAMSLLIKVSLFVALFFNSHTMSWRKRMCEKKS